MSAGACPVRVAIRVRPLSASDITGENGGRTCIQVLDAEGQVQIGDLHRFTFDYAFSSTVSQQEVYDSAVSPLIDAALSG